MVDDLIDLFFSFQGRTGRKTWLFGMAAITAAAVAGLVLLNDDSYDESQNAVRGALTMAAFLWLTLCLFCATALSVKRFNDVQAPRWILAPAIAAGAAIICCWGVGVLLRPLTIGGEAMAFWTLTLLAVPAIIVCLQKTGGHQP